MASSISYDLSGGSEMQSRVAYLMQLFEQTSNRRVNFEVMWEESAALCWPEYRNSFSFGHNRPPGAKYTEFQVDTAGSIASHRFMAIADALVTPYTMLWSKVRASDDDLMKVKEVQEYYNEVTETLWYHRYRAEAGFMGNNQQNWQGLGVFGNMGMMVDELAQSPGKFAPGLRYQATSVGQIYIIRNHQGREVGHIRHFRWTARQAAERWKEKIPAMMRAALDQNSTTLWDFLQFVLPNDDYDPYKIFAPSGKPWSSTYLSVAGYVILEEGGYRSYPRASGCYLIAPEEDYGRGPAQMVLPELKTLNALKSAYLKQAHNAGDPTYLIADDGLMDFKSQPGAYNFGGLTSDGKKLVDILPTGQIQITDEAMSKSSKAVDDAFLVSLFPLLFEQKGGQKSAREVIEMANQIGIFLAPLGRQYGEYLGSLIDRELDLLSYLRLLPKVPDALKEAKGEYQLVYCSPLAKAMQGQPIAGYMRTVEMAKEVVNVTGDPSLMDRFDFDSALPEIADDQFVPARWMASDDQVATKRKARAAQVERDQQSKELPGKAAIMKAQAITAKAQTGGNTGGALSGTPQGGMPILPGQSQNGGTPPPGGP